MHFTAESAYDFREKPVGELMFWSVKHAGHDT